MGASRSGRYGSGRSIAEGLQRFDLAEYMPRPDAVKSNASCIAPISNGKISAQIRYTETATRFGDRRLRILCPKVQPAMPRVASQLWQGCLPPLFPCALSIADLDRICRALHAMARLPRKSIRTRTWSPRISHRACTGAVTIPHREL